MQNCRDAYRIGGESTASGTATYENCMDQISYLNTSGTTWKNDQAWCDGYNSQYVGSVTFDGWYVCSGTSNAGSSLDFGNMADVGVTSSTYLEIPQLTLNDIQDGTPVYIYYSTAAGNTAIPATDVSRIVTGNY